VTQCEALNVNALNIIFTSAFATHLYENQVDIFTPSSESIGIFERLLTCTLKRLVPGQSALLPTRVVVDYFVSLEYQILRERASNIIKRSRKHNDGLKRSQTEAMEDNEQCFTSKRVFWEQHRAQAAPETPNYTTNNEPLLYPDSTLASVCPSNQLETNAAVDNQPYNPVTTWPQGI
jgi:GTPase SAR1 family protein